MANCNLTFFRVSRIQGKWEWDGDGKQEWERPAEMLDELHR